MAHRYNVKSISVHALTLLFLTISTQSLSFPTLSPWKLIDNKHCASFGSQEASPHYQKLIHEFLGNFGVSDPQKVPIRRMASDAAEFYRAPGITRATGIWLNEDSFFQDPLTSQQIYMLAHQAAYYAVTHTKLAALAGIKYVNDKFPVTLPFIELAGNGFLLNKMYQRARQTAPLTTKSIMIDAALLTAVHWVPSLVHDAINRGIAAYSKRLTKKTDLAAARMLCDHGYSTVIEDVIRHLEHDIMQGKVTGNLHPSTQEIRDYLKECLEQWKTETKQDA